MTAPTAITARSLYRTFRQGKVVALDHVDLDTAPGEMVAVTGASGSGKTTLLFVLAGLIAAERGTVTVFGHTPQRPSDWAALRRDTIGMIFQGDLLLPGLSAIENVEVPMIGTALGRADRRRRAESLLERVNAGALRDARPGELSGGERQRIAVARGLANKPRLLLADEPTGELDSVNGEAIVDLLIDLRRKEGLTIVLVTHDRALAARCPRRFVMRDGTGAFDDRVDPSP